MLNKLVMNSLDKLETEFRNIIKTRVDPDITLNELFNKTVIVGTDLNRKKY